MAAPRNGFGRALARLYDYLDGKYLGGDVTSVTGLRVVEEGAGPYRKSTFYFTDMACALTDAAGVVAYTGKKLYDFPAGHLYVLGAVADIALTKSSAGVNATWNGDFAVGTATASNNATLSSTEADLIASTATPAAVAGATTATGASSAPVQLDGSGTAKDLYINLLVDDADQDVTGTPCNLIVNGTLTVHWINLGDY